ncbi:MAG: NapC/NirT family cytochrome c [Elusimicrobiota bacterium]
MLPEHRPEGNYFKNRISMAGGILSVVLFAAGFFLFVMDFLSHGANPYLGVVTYLLLPVFLVSSLLMILAGAWLERRKILRGLKSRELPRIDLNDPLQQRWLLTTAGVGALFLLFSAYGSYRAYEFTESVAFCGRLCHSVMEPEYTAYQNSPHARVACTRCHIGPGAEWFVKAKLSGTYQVYSVLAKKYSRPIKTPIKNLRPAQETCEQCHWPQQFFGAAEKEHRYFLPDEKNSEWRTRMLILVGGGRTASGLRTGIHWHMNIKNKMDYVSTDEKRQKIPWVRATDQEGRVTIYADQESGVKPEAPPAGELRRLDCIDCHNRPSHIFKSPVDAVNEALADGRIDRSLPYIKREAVNALAADYKKLADAQTGIKSRLESFYKEGYPKAWARDRAAIESAAAVVTAVYRANFFPEMGASWKSYPSNIGHMNSPGCFRCHDGRHASADGKKIRSDCSICHTTIEQGAKGAMRSSVAGLEFEHPEEIGDVWKQMPCYECHNGSLP